MELHGEQLRGSFTGETYFKGGVGAACFGSLLYHQCRWSRRSNLSTSSSHQCVFQACPMRRLGKWQRLDVRMLWIHPKICPDDQACFRIFYAVVMEFHFGRIGEVKLVISWPACIRFIYSFDRKWSWGLHMEIALGTIFCENSNMKDTVQLSSLGVCRRGKRCMCLPNFMLFCRAKAFFSHGLAGIQHCMAFISEESPAQYCRTYCIQSRRPGNTRSSCATIQEELD